MMRRQGPGGRSVIPRVRRYIGEVIAELKKVVWPTKEEARRLTIMVIIIAGAIGVILGVMDYGFTRFMEWLTSLGG